MVYVGTSGGVVRSYDLEDGGQNWQFDLPDGIATSPAVGDGSVFVANRSDSADSEATGHCYAIDSSNGDEQWTFDAVGNVAASPVVIDGTVLFQSSSSQLLTAVSSGDGEFRWSQWYRGSTAVMPAVTEDAIYVTSDDELFAFEERTEPLGTSDVGGWETVGGGPRYARYRSDAPALAEDSEIAFDRQLESQFGDELIHGGLFASGGKILAWMVARDALDGDVVWRPPIGIGWPQAVTDGVVALDTWEGWGVFGVSLEDGRIVWHQETESGFFRINGADGTFVITYPRTGTRALDAATGEELWATDSFGGGWMPVMDDETVYVTAPHRNNRIVGYDVASGDEVASAEIAQFEGIEPGQPLNQPPKLGGGQRAPVLGEERLFVPVDGSVLGLNRSTLELQWERTVPEGSSASVRALASDGESVYCSYSGGGVTSLDPGSGDPLWDRSLDSSPDDFVVTDDSIYVGAWQTLYGLDPDTGDDQWTRDFDAILKELALADDRLFLRTTAPPMQEGSPRLLALVPAN